MKYGKKDNDKQTDKGNKGLLEASSRLDMLKIKNAKKTKEKYSNLSMNSQRFSNIKRLW